MLVKWPFSRTTWVSQYQNDSVLDFIAAKNEKGDGDTGAIIRAKLQSNTVTINKPTVQHPIS